MEKNKTIYQISVKSNYLKVEMEIFDEKNDDTYRTVYFNAQFISMRRRFTKNLRWQCKTLHSILKKLREQVTIILLLTDIIASRRETVSC